MSTVKRQLWIFGPAQDTAFVLFTPLLILGTFAAARRGAWMDGLLTFALALATESTWRFWPACCRAR